MNLRKTVYRIKGRLEEQKWYQNIFFRNVLLKEIPNDLTLQVGYNATCNCKCKFCCLGDLSKLKKEDRELSSNIIYNQMLPLYPKVKNLVPTYAEIEASKEGYSWLSWINDKYHHINVFIESNGIGFTKKWQELAVANLMHVKFSLNAHDDSSFNRTVWDNKSNPELFSNTIMKNIDGYVDLLKEKSLYPAFAPSCSCVLNESNYSDVILFVENGLKHGINGFTFFFDTISTNIYSAGEEEADLAVQNAVKHIIELKRVLKGHAGISFQLYLPNMNMADINEKIYSMPLDTLNRKYSHLIELAKQFNTEEQIQSKINLLSQNRKHVLSYEEIIHGPTYHQSKVNGKLVCFNPWSHINVICIERKFNVCTWKGYGPRHDLDHFIDKKGKVDWLGIMNSRYFLLPRREFLHNDYSYCLKNCPGNPNCFDYFGKDNKRQD